MPNTFNERQSRFPALFVSDVHLSENLPRTTEFFLHFLKQKASQAQQLFLLGDLFEYWAGDDDGASPYHQIIIQALRKLSDNGVKLYWIAGNRDFLIGNHFAQEAGVHLLPDPTFITIEGRKLLLSHGDSLCTDDHDYMTFRSMVRETAWQNQFLTLPLTERKAIIDTMRSTSASAQNQKSMTIMDVNQNAVEQLLLNYPECTFIHGHTHRTAIHQHGNYERYVLPDWDYDQIGHQRGGWLELDSGGELRFRAPFARELQSIK
ncbi:UDP-2,3-diacylglucosamine diphosphatase [Undibacterium sp. FT137W]|uniref:UDP-2,3-diacylglucosamine hydrolase n=2 Tax=Undibacterium fentianense TaxID=2828728 RepID=A0A941E0K3_9BURK|nr:UDP-2,3-diacylglucosamine diphosphatase [Undibacterium fentianense]